MNYKLLLIILVIAIMVVAPTLFGIVADGQALDNIDVVSFDKSNLPDVTVELYITSTGEIRRMALDEYVACVLLAEVPSFYEGEAVKALAVAVRSYCMRRIQTSEKQLVHYSADMCDDFSHCLGYISLSDASILWGADNADTYYKIIEQAVADTKGEVLDFEGNIADTVFHSSSNGVTECAENVWGFDIPYLVSVSSPEPTVEKSVEYSSNELMEMLEKAGVICSFDANPEEWVGTVETNKNNRVDMLEIAGAKMTGRRAREVFGLSSTSFDISYTDGKFIFKTQGSGHGVGMSMAGANCMAQDGIGYRDILLHYYSGTKLRLISN